MIVYGTNLLRLSLELTMLYSTKLSSYMAFRRLQTVHRVQARYPARLQRGKDRCPDPGMLTPGLPATLALSLF